MEYSLKGHTWFGDSDEDTKQSLCFAKNYQDCATDKIIAYNDAFEPLVIDEGRSTPSYTM